MTTLWKLLSSLGSQSPQSPLSSGGQRTRKTASLQVRALDSSIGHSPTIIIQVALTTVIAAHYFTLRAPSSVA